MVFGCSFLLRLVAKALAGCVGLVLLRSGGESIFLAGTVFGLCHHSSLQPVLPYSPGGCFLCCSVVTAAAA